MSGATKILAAAGGVDDPVYVEEVFSTFVYEGTGSSLGIDNDIDLADKGGLVWIKNRDATDAHIWTDTERGVTKVISSDVDSAESTDADTLTSFDSDGFTIGADDKVNTDGEEYVSWTFAKKEGFFDIVTWAGNSTSGRTISHNLGSAPGVIIIKSTSTAGEPWYVYHRAASADPETDHLKLHLTNALVDHDEMLNDTAPTSTEFTLSQYNGVNGSSKTYVAYLFAHDVESFGEDSDESIIQCGTYLGSDGADVAVSLGWEPQWLMIKNTERADKWTIIDNMRGLHAKGIYDDNYLAAESNAAEVTGSSHTEVIPTATGFIIPSGASGQVAEAAEKYVYIAIRRPHKPPEAGTDVFSPYAYQDAGLTSGSGTAATRTILNGGSNSGTNFPVDMYWHKDLADTSYGFHVFDRIRGKGEGLLSDLSNGSPAGDSASNAGFDFMEGVDVEYNGTMYYYSHAAGSREHIGHFFKRAPGFFDIVGYRGVSGSAQNISHSLGAVPKMMLIKRHNGSRVWIAYFEPIGNTKYLQASGGGGSGANAAATSSTHWNDTTPTASVFTVGTSEDVNANADYIAYLFGDVDGVSKIGSYTSDGSNNISVTTGFSPRFVMVKCTNTTTTNWLILDTAQGMTTSDVNKSLEWNLSNATNTDSDINIHTSSTGFTVKRGASHLNHSDSGVEYAFLAIA